jgi:hypothetical protein
MALSIQINKITSFVENNNIFSLFGTPQRELTPPGAEIFIFPSFSRHIEKPLDLQFPTVL